MNSLIDIDHRQNKMRAGIRPKGPAIDRILKGVFQVAFVLVIGVILFILLFARVAVY